MRAKCLQRSTGCCGVGATSSSPPRSLIRCRKGVSYRALASPTSPAWLAGNLVCIADAPSSETHFGSQLAHSYLDSVDFEWVEHIDLASEGLRRRGVRRRDHLYVMRRPLADSHGALRVAARGGELRGRDHRGDGCALS